MSGIKITDLPAAPSALLTDVFPVDQLPGPVTYKESNSQLLSLFKANGAALTSTNDTNVTMTLGGSPTTSLLNATSMALGWTGQLSSARGGTGVNNGSSTLTLAGNLATSGAFSTTFTMTGSTNVTFPTSGTLATTAGTVTSVSGTANRVTSTGGTTPVIDISASYVGQSSITTLGTIGIGTWQGATVGGTYGGTGVNNGANTITLGGSLVTAGSFASTFTMTGVTNVTFPTSGTLATTSQLATPAALTKFDDTNVTLTLGGTPATSLLQATSITAGWTGQLSPARGGTGVNNGSSTLTLGGNLTTSGAFASTFTMTGITGVTFPTSGTLATTSQIPTGAALTKTDDTNVTLSLGGSPSTSLVNAASLSLGWTGQLGLTRGGTAASLTASNGGIVYSGSGSLAILAGTATANQMLQSGASTTPSWSTTTYPSTNAINTVMYASSANVMGVITPTNNGALVYSSSGVPSSSTTLPSGLAATNMNLTTPTLGVASATSINFGGGALSSYIPQTTFTPTFTFTTLGDLSVAYAIQDGFYLRIGGMIFFSYVCRFTPTYTTASGIPRFGGLPVASNASATYRANATIAESTTFPVGTTQLVGSVAVGAQYCIINAYGTATAAADLSATQFPTGVQKTVVISGLYAV